MLGTVSDSRTNTPIADAVINLCESNVIAESDSSGKFKFDSIAPGLYNVTATASGYDTINTFNIHIKSGLNNTLVITLKRSSKIYTLPKMQVITTGNDLRKSDQSNSVTTFSNYELKNTAGSVNDPIRIIGTLPSTICGIGEGFRNSLFVRGGDAAENMLVIDGIELQNISHFSYDNESYGLISFLNAELIRDLDFYSGGFPASMPATISSVTDIHLREGSFTDRKTQIDMNIAGLGLSMEGPFSDKFSYLANARFVFFDLVEPFLNESELPLWWDIHTKLNYNKDNNNKFILNFINSTDFWIKNEDLWAYSQDEVVWNGSRATLYKQKMFLFTGGIQWQHLFHSFNGLNKLQLNAQSRSHIELEELEKGKSTSYTINWPYTNHTSQYRADTLFGLKNNYRKVISDNSSKFYTITLKDDFTLFLRENDQIDLGINAKYLLNSKVNKSLESLMLIQYTIDTSQIDSIILLGQDETKGTDLDSTLHSFQMSGYLQYVFMQNWFKVIAGVRGDYYYLFRDYAFSPRIAMTADAGKAGIFSFSGGLFYQQHPAFFTIMEEFFLPDPRKNISNDFDIHFYDLELQRNFQAVLGYKKTIQKVPYIFSRVLP